MATFRTGEYVGEIKRTGIETWNWRKVSGVGWCSSELVGGKEWLWLGLGGLVYGKEGLWLGKGTTCQQGLD